MKTNLIRIMMLVCAGIVMLSLVACVAESDDPIDNSIYGKVGTFSFECKGSTQVGVFSKNYFTVESNVREVPNIIIEAKGDTGTFTVQGFTSEKMEYDTSDFVFSGLKMAPGTDTTDFTPVDGSSYMSGSLTFGETCLQVDSVKIKGLKVTTSRIAIQEMFIFYGENKEKCVRLMNIIGVAKL